MPAMPRSRRAHLQAMSLRAVPKGSSGSRDSLLTVSVGAASPVKAGTAPAGSSRPIIMRARLAGSPDGVAVPVTLPPRITVALWHRLWISCSLWLM
jgi:hypothetical protein